MAGQSLVFDFIGRGAGQLAADLRKTGDNAAAAARGTKVLTDTIDRLGSKENRTADESARLAQALRLTGDAADRATARAVVADAAIRRLADAESEAAKKAGGARGGIAGLAGAVTGFGDAATAASSKSTTFQKALAGINLATGVLEPALAGLLVTAGGLAAGFASAAAGLSAFSLVAKANLSAAGDAAKKVSTAQTAYTAAVAAANSKYAQAMDTATTKAQRQSAATARQNALQSAQAAEVRATTAAYAGLTPAQVSLSKSIGAMQDRWQKFTASFAPMVSQVVGTVQPLFGTVLGYIGKLATAGGTAIQALLPSLGVALNSKGFKDFISTLATNAGPAIVKLGTAIGHVAVGLGGVLRAFMPFQGQLLTGLDKITAKFAQWGQTLSSHTGFQSLISTFKTETPLAIQVLTNLGTVLLNIGKAITGLSGVGNSKSLLQLLIPLSGVLASLSKNTALDRIALYLYAATSAAQKLAPAILGVKAAVSFFPNAWQAIVKFAAAAEGATTAETIAAAATRAWGLAMDALPWVALAAAVVAVAVLIIKYHTQIWNFIKKVWNDILGVIMGVWHWIQANWPLLLGIITGPVGLAVLWIVQHFGTITGAVKSVLSAVSVAWNAVWNTLKAGFRIFVVDGILGPLGLIVHGAAAAFGWVPGLGGKLKSAAKAFDNFRNDVNKALGGINGRTVSVSVAMTSATNPYPGGISGRKARGGRITGPGGPTSDTAGLYALSNNEWVIRADSASRYGLSAMDAVNRGTAVIGYASGGGVNVKANAPSYKTVEADLMASVTKLATAFAKAAQAAGGAPGALGGPTSASAAQAQAYAKSRLGAYGWGAGQMPPLVLLWNRESGWNRLARNPSSGAYGIPQSLPASKMGAAANPPTSSAAAQINWGLGYIKGRYGSPAGAWGHEQAYNWYDRGGLLRPGLTLAMNGTGRSEQVVPGEGLDAMIAELRALRGQVAELTRTTAAVPAATGRHVAAGVNGATADAAFRGRYPGR